MVVELVDNSHTSLSPVIADTVTFSVNLIYGCTDSTAVNYNPNATVDDGSCNDYTCPTVSLLPTGNVTLTFTAALADTPYPLVG